MTMTGEFETKSWDEQPSLEASSEKMTRATVSQQFRGDIDGEGTVEWLMCYRPDGTAHFVGLQRVEGAVRGRRGTFVVESYGEFDGKKAMGRWDVITATGDLEGMSGTGSFEAPMGPKASYHAEFKLP
jgi:hypothetical protein